MIDQKKTYIKIPRVGIVRFRKVLFSWFIRHNRIAKWPIIQSKPAAFEKNILSSIAQIRRGRGKQQTISHHTFVQLDEAAVAAEWQAKYEKSNRLNISLTVDNDKKSENTMNPRSVVLEAALLFPILDAKTVEFYFIFKPNADDDFLLAQPDQQAKKRFEFMRYLIERGVFTDEIQDSEEDALATEDEQNRADESI